MQHTHPAPRPWYREPWPWILFGLPLISVIVGVMFLATAIRTDDGLVTDDYYKKGKAINMELRRDKQAFNMGLSAQLMVGSDQRTLRLITTSKVALPATITMRMVHPAQDDFDQQVDMRQAGPNLYQATLPTVPVKANHWYILLEDQAKQWRLQGEWKPAEGQTVSLGHPNLEPAD
ncbi:MULTISPECIES: FixH family protein [Chromobacterium]|uniref:FixH family protein n=1 Tax=Chromobacterium TaxID=535 RepID=UPI000D311C45|nr:MULTISPECIES: FixH family protein [Chromobacterium]PTU63955.1 nitrogen fixation protein FixH [Chromobacterium sp. Panama]UJB32005.1 FixH family protein [Chromobacterium sp. Beijing]